MNAAPEIKGWCPGALRPMQSGDGLLLRAKTVGPRISARQAFEIAAIALDCGNGCLDLSQRAQLQLRGVGEETLREALRRLDAIGLLASDRETESILNIIAPPLAGVDEAAEFDALRLVAELAAALANDKSLRALPGKFCFLIDGGGDQGLADSSADIRFEAIANERGRRVAVVADGARDKAIAVAIDQAVETALALARAFLSLRKGREFELRRMRRLVEALGADALAREAGLALAPYRSACGGAEARRVFGAHAIGAKWFAGAGAPFGRWRAQDIVSLAEQAAVVGGGELRLSPWRAILIPAATREAAQHIVDAARKLGLIVDGDDPRLAVVACPGAPECPQARGATREAAQRLGPLAKALHGTPAGASLHVSGCTKGCAKPDASPATIIRNENGFDLIIDGRADDPPAKRALTLKDVEEELSKLAAPSGMGGACANEEAPCPAH
jgi:precorrin-3B synthase